MLALLWAGEAFGQSGTLVQVEKAHEILRTQTVPVIGRLVARRAGLVSARIAGRLERMHVDVGDRVKKGDIIATLASDHLRADLALAEGALKEARAERDTAKAELEQALAEMRRQRRLRQSAAFSKARLEDAELKIKVARSRIAFAEAKIATRKAAVTRRALDVKYATVRAPYSGTVVQRLAEAGTYVRTGDALVRLIGTRSLEIEADVPAKRLSGLAIDQILDITLDDGTRHKARVRAILPSENPLTRTRAVRLTPILHATHRVLADGQSVTVLVPIGTRRPVLTVHKDAVLNTLGAAIVFVVENGIAHPRPVTLGEAVGDRIEVLTGLRAGEVVVVRGNERLTPGSPVRIVIKRRGASKASDREQNKRRGASKASDREQNKRRGGAKPRQGPNNTREAAPDAIRKRDRNKRAS